MKKTTLILSLICLSSAAFAQSESSRLRLTTEPIALAPVGFVPYLGVGAGYSGTDTFDKSTQGVPSNIKLLGSFYQEDHRGVYDLGLGASNQQFISNDSQAKAMNGNTLEAAARYQWESRWQAGVVYNTIFDRGNFYGANQGDAQFAGLQALKEFDLGQAWLARVGGRLMTDINVPGQMVNMAIVDLQVGWNPNAQRQSVSKAAPARTTRPVQAMIPNPTLPSLMAELSDRPGVAHFAVDSASVPKEDQKRLARLAKNLEKRTDLFQSVEVVGHTDPTGTESHNQILSEERANSVRQVLVSAGWPADKLSTFGRGETQPVILSPMAPNFGDNRRVEIRFQGVKDETELRRLLASAR